jgi:hypothetical protein
VEAGSKEIATQVDVLNNSIEEMRKKRQILLEEMRKVFRDFWPHQFKIMENGCCELKTIMQLGAQILESKDLTHFIMPSSVVLKNIIPNEYEFSVMTYSPDKRKFSTVYKGTEAGCCSYVIAWQEKYYDFSVKVRNEKQQELINISQYFAETSEFITDEEENDKLQADIERIQKEVRIELNMLTDDDISDSDVKKSIKEAVSDGIPRSKRMEH